MLVDLHRNDLFIAGARYGTVAVQMACGDCGTALHMMASSGLVISVCYGKLSTDVGMRHEKMISKYWTGNENTEEECGSKA